MLWADRTTVKRTTGMTPARAVYGAEHIIPIETEEPTWGTIRWDDIRSTEDVLLLRSLQIDR